MTRLPSHISAEEKSFLNDAYDVDSLKPARAAIVMMYVIFALCFVAVIWAAITQVDSIARAQGRVVPSSEIQIVQSLEGGILSELLVNEGQVVEKDQVLMRLSDVQNSSERRGVLARWYGLKAKRARLAAESSDKDLVLPEDVLKNAPDVARIEEDFYISRKRELDNALAILIDKINKAQADRSETAAQIERLTESRRLLLQELEITRNMVAQRAMPKLEQIRLERELNDIDGQMNANAQRLKSLDADLEVARKESQSQHDRFKSLALGEMNDVETEIAGLSERIKSIGDRVDRSELRAPVAGIVNAIAIKTIGGVIEPAKKLVEIVPIGSSLKIIAQVDPQQVAFLRKDLAARVKITAYDSHKYGSLEGVLARVAANSQTDPEGKPFFEIEVQTHDTFMGTADAPLPITPGMVAQVEIITGKRTVLDYLLKPFFQARERALTER